MTKALHITTHSRRTGFTLVEMSIVLVIIGLITGGIVAARAMIRTAELNKIARDQQQLRTAVDTYRVKFNAVPGDDPKAFSFFGSRCCPDTATACTGASPVGAFGGGGDINYCNGNGDGIYKNVPISAWPGYYDAVREAIMMWRHLALAGYMNPLLSGLYGSGKDGTAGLNIPKTGFSAGMHFRGDSVSDALVTFGTHTLTIGEYANSPGDSSGNPSGFSRWSNQDQAAFDQKYDDGLPLTGKIRGGNIWPNYCAVDGSTNAWRTGTQGCYMVYVDWIKAL